MLQFSKLKVAALLILGLIASVANATIINALKIKVYNATYSDEAVVRFHSMATVGFDGSYDSWKMFSSNPAVPSVFTNIDPVSHLAINALPALMAPTDVDLYTQVNTTGLFTLESVEIGAFNHFAKILLEDKQTGVLYNFRAGQIISVTITANTISTANRFVLHFYPAPVISTFDATRPVSGGVYLTQSGNKTDRQLKAEDEAETDPDLTAIIYEAKTNSSLEVLAAEGGLQYNFTAETPTKLDLYVYNTAGQVIYEYHGNQAASLNEKITLPVSGIYIVYSSVDTTIASQKINFIK